MTRPKLRRPCVDCQSPTRPAPYPGPRCATDDRAARKRSRLKARAAYLLRTYNITLEAYLAMLTAQGGTCAWPGCPASGKARFLAVDHDHACCPGRKSCGKCVRGLLCFVHNRAIGQAGDDPTVFEGVAAYLRRPGLPIGDLPDEDDELDALRAFVADISAGGYTKVQIVKSAVVLADLYGLER